MKTTFRWCDNIENQYHELDVELDYIPRKDEYVEISGKDSQGVERSRRRHVQEIIWNIENGIQTVTILL